MIVGKKPPYLLFVTLYTIGVAYAVAMLGFGDAVGLLTVITFGVLVFVYYFFLALAPIIATIAGLQAIRSGWFACLVGYPCALMFAFITPVVSDQKSLGVPVPWLARFPDSQADALPQTQLSLEISTALFAITLAIGFIVRWRRAKREGSGEG